MLLQDNLQSMEGEEDNENAAVATVKGYSVTIKLTILSEY